MGAKTQGAYIEKVKEKGPEISGPFPLTGGGVVCYYLFSWKRYLLFLQSDTDSPLESFLPLPSVSFSYGFSQQLYILEQSVDFLMEFLYNGIS